MNSRSRTARHVFLAFAFILLPGASIAQEKSAAPLRVVLKGYDPVAYFTESRPVKGVPEFSYDWDGERYLFSSAANRNKFAAAPERYAPQFGGYCTGSMSGKMQREADPQAWIISDGRLYVFGQVKFADMARNDANWLAGRIPLAAANWQEMKK